VSRRKRYTRNLGRALKSPTPVQTTVEWVRFEHEDAPFGVFWFLPDATENLGSEARDEMDSLRSWFCDRLKVPDMALIERCWFKAEAHEHIERARRLCELVRHAGIPIVERRTRRIPGKVRYEGDHQVALVTYRDAPQPCPRRRRSRAR
jgi:hypothetical protein